MCLIIITYTYTFHLNKSSLIFPSCPSTHCSFYTYCLFKNLLKILKLFKFVVLAIIYCTSNTKLRSETKTCHYSSSSRKAVNDRGCVHVVFCLNVTVLNIYFRRYLALVARSDAVTIINILLSIWFNSIFCNDLRNLDTIWAQHFQILFYPFLNI